MGNYSNSAGTGSQCPVVALPAKDGLEVVERKSPSETSRSAGFALTTTVLALTGPR